MGVTGTDASGSVPAAFSIPANRDRAAVPVGLANWIAGSVAFSASTVSLSPNSATLPASRISSLFTAASALGRCAITMTTDPAARSAAMVRVRAASPAISRLELGSSSTTSAGMPNTARASPSRCICPPDKGCAAPGRPSQVA